jgi:hypothetical protein
MELIFAIRSGRYIEVDNILSDTINDDIVNFVDDSDKTPLIYACEYNDIAIVKILLQYNLNVTDKYYQYAKDIAKSEIRQLLELINNTTFNQLAFNGYFAFVKHHIEKIQPIINNQDDDGNTILYYAIKSKNPKLIKYLLEHQTSLDVENNSGIPMAIYLFQIKEIFMNNVLWIDFKDYIHNLVKGEIWEDNLYWAEKEFNHELNHKRLTKEFMEKDISGNIYKLTVPDTNGDTVLVKRILGKGANGVVYHGYLYHEDKPETSKIDIAVKTSYVDPEDRTTSLYIEVSFYKSLRGYPGIPKLYGPDPLLIDSTNNISMLFVEYLDMTLYEAKELFYHNENNTLIILNQIINIIEIATSKQLALSDISPSNFMIKNDFTSTGQLYLSDMGSLQYAILPISANMVVYTLNYMSIHSHVNPHHKFNILDSLESAGYTVAKLLCDTLPWNNIPEDIYDVDTQNQYILNKKQTASGSELTCMMSPKIAAYIDYVRTMNVSNADIDNMKILRDVRNISL